MPACSPSAILLACAPHPALLCARRWFKSRAHAAELTAGYYNTRERNGYLPIFDMLKRHSAAASFTCVEMRDCEHPIEGRCSPEGLLNQVGGGPGRGARHVQAAAARREGPDAAPLLRSLPRCCPCRCSAPLRAWGCP